MAALSELNTLSGLDISEQYKLRLDVAWESLGADVDRWMDAGGRLEGTIAYDIEQFKSFRNSAYSVLVEGAPDAPEDFQAIVISVMTAYWALLRQVATQRIEKSPYRSKVEELDHLSRRYYHHLRNALPENLRKNVSTRAPIIHLGRIGMITVFNSDAPLVLSIPYNAIDGDIGAALSQNAIPHEIGHAILIQAPAILDELTEKLNIYLRVEVNPKTEKKPRPVLRDLILGWLIELLADIFGTFLAGDQFVVSAIWITAGSEDNVGLADETHPPAVVRPFVHLKVLEYLQTRRPSEKMAAQIEQLKSTYPGPKALRELYVSTAVGNRLNQQFRSVPELTFITMDEVKMEVEHAVDYMLNPATTLKALDDKSLGKLLVEAMAPISPDVPNEKLQAWGIIPEEELADFSLPLPSTLTPELHTPLTLSHGICRYLPFLRCSP